MKDPIDKWGIPDPVNHPKHYTSHPSGVEAITITRHMSFNIGNAIKYLWRNGLKDGQPAVQDLEKAVWYIQDEIKRLGGTVAPAMPKFIMLEGSVKNPEAIKRAWENHTGKYKGYDSKTGLPL